MGYCIHVTSGGVGTGGGGGGGGGYKRHQDSVCRRGRRYRPYARKCSLELSLKTTWVVVRFHQTLQRERVRLGSVRVVFTLAPLAPLFHPIPE